MTERRERIRDQVKRVILFRGRQGTGMNLRIMHYPNSKVPWAVMGLTMTGTQHKQSREPCNNEGQVLTYVQECMERLTRKA